MGQIEIRRDGVVVCVCKDESCLYSDEIMKDMKVNGYKFYQDGKIYKPEKKVGNNNEGKG
jgi:hypothetical protein